MIKSPHLERLLLILEAVSRTDPPPNTSELCGVTDLPPATVYRLLRELTDSGLLQVEPERRYSIGHRLKSIASAGQTDRDVAEVASPLLKEAADEFTAAFFLSRARGNGVEIIHVETPKDDTVSYLHPGLGFRPMHACSCSKAIAAHSTQVQVKKDADGRLRAYTEYTHTDVSKVEAELETIRKQGFAECVQEIELGICSVAAPVLHKNHNCTLSIGATGSLRHFSQSHRRRIGKQLKAYTVQLASELEQNTMQA